MLTILDDPKEVMKAEGAELAEGDGCHVSCEENHSSRQKSDTDTMG